MLNIIKISPKAAEEWAFSVIKDPYQQLFDTNRLLNKKLYRVIDVGHHALQDFYWSLTHQVHFIDANRDFIQPDFNLKETKGHVTAARRAND